MMTQTTTFWKHWRRTLFLLICGGLVLLIGLLAFSDNAGAVEGDPLTMFETMTYEPDGLFVFNFTAEKSFTLLWELSGGDCQPKAGNPTGFYFYVADFNQYGVGGWRNGYALNKDNIGMFNDAGNCVQSDVFTAGHEYSVYLVLGDSGFFDPSHTPAQIKEGYLRDLDEESIFLSAQNDASVQYTHDFLLTYPPTINIISPADDSEMSSSFDITATYLNSGTYEKLMVIFEEWDASSTCPVYGTDAWDAEVALGYFNYQSLPYFSDWILTDSGTTTISVSNLEAGTYNCFKCHFITESTGAMSGALCPDYNLDVAVYIPPSFVPTFYLPLTEWSSYYASNSVRWTTSTPVFDNWANAFEPIIVWVGQTAIFFEQYFDMDLAKTKGEEIGDAIAVARGYLEVIDDFFGGLPLSGIFLFYIITALVVIIYRIVKGILNIIVP
jgi:hypothetical protein